MRISELEIALSAADLKELLLALRPVNAGADLEHVTITGPELRVRVRAEALPFPVELVATIARTEPDRLVLNVDIANMGFVPGALRTAALDFFGSRVAAPGITFQGGELSIATAALSRTLKADFTLARAVLGEGKLRLTLRDVQVGVRPATPMAAAPEPGAAEHSGTAPGPGAPDPARPGHGPGEPDPASPGGWAGDLPPSRGLEGEHRETYESVRRRIAAFLDRSFPDWMQPAVPWLLLLPDFLVLLARLAADRRISARAKLVAAGALGYIALPVDLAPDFLPGLGLLDDVAVALLALEALVAMSPVEVVQEHWPGNQDVLETLRKGLQWAGAYFPKGMVRRMRDWLERAETQRRAPDAGRPDQEAGPPPAPPLH